MKQNIHPEYRPVVFMDTTTGYKFLSGSTKASDETVEFEGATYPLVRVEISSDSHPFYTGRQKFTQADGRVDRFNKKIRFHKIITVFYYRKSRFFLRATFLLFKITIIFAIITTRAQKSPLLSCCNWHCIHLFSPLIFER